MADTGKVVTWSLGKSCLLRPDGSDDARFRCSEELQRARDYSDALREPRRARGIFGDVFVSSYDNGEDGEVKGLLQCPPYPTHGFLIADSFRAYGGAAALFEMCAHCPANTAESELAGCFGWIVCKPGWFLCEPESPRFDAQLRRIVDRLGIGAQMEASFPKTNPLWYGLWAVSPVPRPGLPLLGMILSEVLAEDRHALSNAHIHDLSRLITAVKLADERDLPLQVSLSTPGHTDFGNYTIFPHCPFCKATARTQLWAPHSKALQKCHVCGVLFAPAETASSQPDGIDLEGNLRELLGAELFRFAREYLIALGESPEAAESIVVATEAMLQRRRTKTLTQDGNG